MIGWYIIGCMKYSEILAYKEWGAVCNRRKCSECFLRKWERDDKELCEGIFKRIIFKAKLEKLLENN